MMNLDSQLVVAKDLIRVIFENLDLVWLKSMWDNGGSTRAKIIEIVIMLALLRLRH
jgi:hypothetical protein